MSQSTRRSHSRRVVVLIKDIDKSEMSCADITRRVRSLCSEFDVTILTGNPHNCRELFPDAHVIGPPEIRFISRELQYLAVTWPLLPFLKYDGIYVADVISVPGILTKVRSRILCYGNTHPSQHVIMRLKRTRNLGRSLTVIYGAMLIRSLRKCDMIYAISPQLATIYREQGIRDSNIKVAQVGFDPAKFAKPASRSYSREGTVNIGVYTGTVSEERGLSVMIDGARIAGMTRRDFRIKLIGCRDPDVNTVKDRLRAADVEDLFEVIPRVPYSEIPAILWDSNWAISLLEPNVYFQASPPIKILEYMAAGLPVIANDIQTHRLYLEHERNSLLIDYTPEAFAKAVLRLVGNPKLTEELSSNATRMACGREEKAALDELVQGISSMMSAEGDF